MSNWTQPVCDDCWDERNPDRRAARTNSGEPEKCCYCGAETYSGIYVRINPFSVMYPAS